MIRIESTIPYLLAGFGQTLALNEKPYSPYYHRLRAAVEQKASSTFEADPNLFQKWYLSHYMYEEGDARECACGKKNIKNLFFMKMRGRKDLEILVGSECVNQFKVPKAVELMSLLEKGIAVEYVKRGHDDKKLYKISRLGASRRRFLKKMFPELFKDSNHIVVRDAKKVLKRDEKVEQLLGQLYLKAIDPDENHVEFFIWRFEKKRMKSKNSIIIDRKVWTMKRLRYPCISKWDNPCPVQDCTAYFQPGVTSIIPCERDGENDKWICASHRG